MNGREKGGFGEERVEKEKREKRREGGNGGHLQPSVDTLLVEVMATGSEGSYLLPRLELTHTHHTTEGGREGGISKTEHFLSPTSYIPSVHSSDNKPHKKELLNTTSL